MSGKRVVSLAAVVAVTAAVGIVAGVVAQTGQSAAKSDSVVLIYNGPAIANAHAAPQTAAFNTWCAGVCAPSVALPVADVENGIRRGAIYVWTKNFTYSADGNSLCFGEFIWYALNDGDVYTNSGSNGTCGGFIAPSLKAP